MNSQEQSDYNPKQKVSSELQVMQPGEVIISDIKRHPIGILGIYIGITIMLTLVAYFAFGILPSLSANGTASSDSLTQIGAVVFLFLATVCLIYAAIATKVYWGNRWIVTSDSITQVAQNSLFGRQSSQLALTNIEDVTAEQHGILTHVFNYGVIKAETAGHHGKFVFMYCPNPNFYAQKILQAREALGSSGHHGVVGPPPQPTPPQ